MKRTVNVDEFINEFEIMGKGNSFSDAGKRALFEYLEEMNENTELDVIAIDCEFVEYTDIKELKKVYPHIKNIEQLEEETIVIKIDKKSFIISEF